MTLYDDLPVEVRRDNWGWFGPPWWSYVCYDEDGGLLEETRKPFPAGESCLLCGEPFDEAAGDSGQATPVITGPLTEAGDEADVEIRHSHKECQFMNVVGSLAHQEGRCSCYGGSGETAQGMTYRQEALEVWRRYARVGDE